MIAEDISQEIEVEQLNIGYLNYPQFSGRNGDPKNPHGLAVDLLHNVAARLHVNPDKLYPVELNWNNLVDSLYNYEVDIIIDPILQTPSRKQISIIPYSKVRCFKLLFHSKIGEHVKSKRVELAKAFEFDNISLKELALRIHNGLGALAPAGTRFVIGEGMYEQDFLNYFYVSYESIKFNGSPPEELIDKLTKGQLIITDEPLGNFVLNQVPPRMKAHFHIEDLLTNWPPLIRKKLEEQNAGFAVLRSSDLCSLVGRLEPNKMFSELCSKKNIAAHSLGVKFLEDYPKPRDLFENIGDSYLTKEFVLLSPHKVVDPKPIIPDEKEPALKKEDIFIGTRDKIMLAIFFVLLGTLLVINVAVDLPTPVLFASWFAFWGLVYEFCIIVPQLIKSWTIQND